MNSQETVIKAGWLIDGSGSDALKNCLITINTGEITSVTHIAADDTDFPSDYLDCSGCTLIPGLVDSHTHLTISGSLEPEIRDVHLTDEYDSALPRLKQHIRDYLAWGVVAVRDGGDFHAHVLRYKNDFKMQKEFPLTIYAAGNGFHKKGRYGQLLGMYIDPEKDLAQSILESYKPGIDHIKVVNSGVNSLSKFGRETSPQFTKEELKRAVKAADSIDLKIMVHANGKLPVRLAIESGCHSIEHGFFMGEDNLKRMADSGTIWCPTACTMKAYRDISDPDKPQHKVAEQNMNHQLEQIKKAMAYGVKIVLGTDAGCPGVYHGKSVVEEFSLLMQAGYSAEQAVKSATSTAMELTGDESGKGTIAKGMTANLVAVKGTPASFPEALEEIKGVWVNGDRL